MIPFNWFVEAKERITPFIKTTPITYDSANNIYLKWENQQITGSFKVRGALNKVFCLEKWEQDAGIIAASAGNHGLGVALAGTHINIPVKIFIPENAPKVKIDGIKKLGAEVILVSGRYGDAENAAKTYARKINGTWISPYNDGQVISGQGTIAAESIEQLEVRGDTEWENMLWLVPTSGGGLLAGIATALEYMNPKTIVIGVQANTSPFLHSIFHHGSQDGVEELPTLADGLAGPVEEGSITIPLVKQNVDDIILVSEGEIAHAVAYCWHQYGVKIEPAAGVVLGAILNHKIKQRPAFLVISGGNIQKELFDSIIINYPKT